MSDKILENILQKIVGIDLDLAKRILDTISAGISIATDVSCKEIIYNSKATEFLRIKPWDNLSHTASPDQPVKLIHNGKELSPSEMPIQQETLPSASGPRRRCMPARSGSRSCSSLDITERIKMQKEMARLDRLNLIGEMAAGIGHEVRNPMTTVRGFLQLLEGEGEVRSGQGQA